MQTRRRAALRTAGDLPPLPPECHALILDALLSSLEEPDAADHQSTWPHGSSFSWLCASLRCVCRGWAAAAAEHPAFVRRARLERLRWLVLANDGVHFLRTKGPQDERRTRTACVRALKQRVALPFSGVASHRLINGLAAATAAVAVAAAAEGSTAAAGMAAAEAAASGSEAATAGSEAASGAAAATGAGAGCVAKANGTINRPPSTSPPPRRHISASPVHRRSDIERRALPRTALLLALSAEEVDAAALQQLLHDMALLDGRCGAPLVLKLLRAPGDEPRPLEPLPEQVPPPQGPPQQQPQQPQQPQQHGDDSEQASAASGSGGRAGGVEAGVRGLLLEEVAEVFRGLSDIIALVNMEGSPRHGPALYFIPTANGFRRARPPGGGGAPAPAT